MAAGDVAVLSNSLGVHKLPVDTRTNNSHNATIKHGEALKRQTNTDHFLTFLLTGDPEIATDIFVGIAAEESTETGSAEGDVDVDVVKLGTKLRANATTASNIDTQAKLDDVLMDFVAFDGPAAASTASFNYTIDENEGDDPNVHGLFIVGGDIVKGTLDVLVTGSTIYESTV